MRTALLALLLLATMLIGACSKPRAKQYTYTKTGVSEAMLDRHLQEIRDTRGVLDYEAKRDSTDMATIVVYLDADEPFAGREMMRDLGYRRVGD